MNCFRALLLASLCLAAGGCAERPRIGIEIGTPTMKDCIPSSATKPCN